MTLSLWIAASLWAFPASAQDHAGPALFDSHGCRSCHRIDGVGGNAGPDLTLVGFRRPARWLDRWLESPRSWKHDALMPELKLSPSSRRALVEYMASLRHRGGREWPSDGRGLYARAGCVACHGVEGRGGHPNNNVPGRLIPALRDTAATFSEQELRVKIKRGSRPEKADASGEEPLAAMPAWGEVLSDEEIGALARYVLSLAPPGEKTEW